MDPASDPDPASAFFVSGCQMPTKISFFRRLFADYCLKVHLHQFSKIKSQKEVKKLWKSRFFLPFCLLTERSVSGSAQIMSDLDQ
jgi:hypothetical protein